METAAHSGSTDPSLTNTGREFLGSLNIDAAGPQLPSGNPTVTRYSRIEGGSSYLISDSRPGGWRTRLSDFPERLFAAGFGTWKDLARLQEVRAQHGRGDGPPYRSSKPSAKNKVAAKRK